MISFINSTIGLLNGNSENRRESVKIKIEGLSSLKNLHLGKNSTEMYFSLRNLCSLKYLTLWISCTIDDDIITNLMSQVKHIEHLFLHGSFSYFNLDNLSNLKELSLVGTINENFNYELFKNLCNQLDAIYICLNKFDDKTFLKLFDGHNFSKLQNFVIRKYNIKILKKEFINRFPKLRQLFISECNLEEIELDAFSNSQQLFCLDLSQNRLKFIEKNMFLNLMNLEVLDLSKNELKNLDKEIIGITRFLNVDIILENNDFATFNCYWFWHYYI